MWVLTTHLGWVIPKAPTSAFKMESSSFFPYTPAKSCHLEAAVTHNLEPPFQKEVALTGLMQL